MAPQAEQSTRTARRLQTRERILTAAVAEFTVSAMTGADINAIAADAGVAHGTFFFHLPSKEHELLDGVLTAMNNCDTRETMLTELVATALRDLEIR